MGRIGELESGYDSNSPYYVLKAMKLISHIRDFNSGIVGNELSELRSRIYFNPVTWRAVGEILTNDPYREAAFYGVEEGVLSRDILIAELRFSLAGSTRTILALTSVGFIAPCIVLPRPKSKRGGPRVRLYQTPDATPEQVTKAVELQRRLESPKYVQAMLVTQTLLEDYPVVVSSGETSYKDIVTTIKKMKISYGVPDMAQLASKYLHERGIKVWR
jgi:hypothetical protein